MIVVHNRLTVPPDYADHLERAFAGRREALARVPGFVSFDLLKREDAGEYVVMTRWQTRADFDRWLASDAFQKAHSGVNPNSPVQSRLEVFEVIASQSAGS